MKGPTALKIIAGAAVAMLVLGGGISLWIDAVASRRMQEMEREVRSLHDRMQGPDSSRSPRPGTAVPGNAWDDYNKALAAVQANRGALEPVNAFVFRHPDADREKAVGVVAAHAATIDLLRRGAHREKSDPGLQWEQGFDMPMPGPLTCQRLGSLVAARARLLAEEGKPREAAELLIDGCQFARDLGTNTTLITFEASMAVYSVELEELRDLLLSGSLSKEDFLVTGLALETADRTYPKRGETGMNETLCLGYSLLKDTQSVDLVSRYGLSIFTLWRYGFSTRVALASAFSERLSMSRRIAATDERPWPEVLKVISDLEAEVHGSKNPFVRTMIPKSTGVPERIWSERRAQLRLLRAAAAWRATGEFPELDDPLGTKLLHSEKDGQIRIWSVGRDGTDHGGVGTWKLDPGRDILLEWKR